MTAAAAPNMAARWLAAGRVLAPLDDPGDGLLDLLMTSNSSPRISSIAREALIKKLTLAIQAHKPVTDWALAVELAEQLQTIFGYTVDPRVTTYIARPILDLPDLPFGTIVTREGHEILPLRPRRP